MHEQINPNSSFEVSITIGVDGRIYCHDITPELFPVLAAVCGNDSELVTREECDEGDQ
ncbi:MAG TPA: hypothetical protein VNT79_13660 [Phycisphaerae bacterium]|nr:hypothetical protein [Phycisphaerae bacterium]